MKALWIDRLNELGRESSHLDTPPELFNPWWDEMGDYAEQYLDRVAEAPAFYGLHPVVSGVASPPEAPEAFAKVLGEYDRTALRNGINPASGRFFGYIPGGGIPAAAFGDFAAALTNPYSGAYGACPGAADIENQVVGWLRDWLGFPPESWGTLQSGGSLATLTAIVAARATRPFADWPRSVVYQTAETHHCFSKALKIAGLEAVPRRIIPVDNEQRMSVPDLERQIEADKATGLLPWLVCASAGTTNTGAIDPLAAIGQICRKQKIWFHVDAAYGGFFYLVESMRPQLTAMGWADSLVLDPHKGLFQPYGLGAVLVRQASWLKDSLSFEPDYMQDISDPSVRSPMDYSPELTRPFRAARLWFALKLHGLKRYRAALEEKLLLARYAYEDLKMTSGIVLGPAPQLSVVTFRAHGDGSSADEATQRLHATLLQRGVVHLSSTKLHCRVFLRMCVLSFRSHLAEVDRALDEIKGDL